MEVDRGILKGSSLYVHVLLVNRERERERERERTMMIFDKRGNNNQFNDDYDYFFDELIFKL